MKKIEPTPEGARAAAPPPGGFRLALRWRASLGPLAVGPEICVQLSAPPSSAPMPPPPECDGFYSGDQVDDEISADSSLSTDGVIARIDDDASGRMADSPGERV